MKKTLVVLSILIAATVSGAVRASDAVFPHRAKFKHVPVIEAEALRKDLDNAIVIDVRTRYEYATLHLDEAVSGPERAARQEPGPPTLSAARHSRSV